MVNNKKIKSMKKVIIIVFVLLGVFLMNSCKKEDVEPVQPLVFNSLTSSSNVFSPGGSAYLNADVSGLNVQYYWTYNSGIVTGTGNAVYYTNEEIGAYTVLCTVIDGAGEIESKQIVLTVQ